MTNQFAPLDPTPRPPAHVAVFSDVMGIELAAQFLMIYGGGECFFPKRPKPSSDLVKLLGRDIVVRMANLDKLPRRVPLAKPWLAHYFVAKGDSIIEISRKLKVTDTTVRRWLSPQPRPDPPSIPRADPLPDPAPRPAISPGVAAHLDQLRAARQVTKHTMNLTRARVAGTERTEATAQSVLKANRETGVKGGLNGGFKWGFNGASVKGRHSKLDTDPELREFVLARIETMTFAQIADEIADAFPEPRRLRPSAIGHWWRGQVQL